MTDYAHVWNEWGRLTKFLESARVALRRESSLWTSLELKEPSIARVRTTDGQSTYEVNLDHHLAALADIEILCAMVLIYNYALAEGTAADVLKKAIQDIGGIEVWGKTLLETNGKSWSLVKDGDAGLVEVAVVRNQLAHGCWTLTQTSYNRLKNARAETGWKVGQRIELGFQRLDEYRARLKSLLRYCGIRAVGEEP